MTLEEIKRLIQTRGGEIKGFVLSPSSEFEMTGALDEDMYGRLTVYGYPVLFEADLMIEGVIV